MRLIFVCLSFLGLFAVPVLAGPWPRAEGKGFVSASRELRDGQDWSAIYAEYGISNRVTFVFDAGAAEAGGEKLAIASLRLPVWASGAQRIAVSFGSGLGQPSDDDTTRHAGMSYPVVQALMTWGTEITTPKLNGWSTLDATFRETPGADEAERKLDATLGVHLGASGALVSQAQFSDRKAASEQLRLGVGWVEHIGQMAVEAGVGKRLRQNRETDLKIGVWFDF